MPAVTMAKEFATQRFLDFFEARIKGVAGSLMLEIVDVDPKHHIQTVTSALIFNGLNQFMVGLSVANLLYRINKKW